MSVSDMIVSCVKVCGLSGISVGERYNILLVNYPASTRNDKPILIDYS